MAALEKTLGELMGEHQATAWRTATSQALAEAKARATAIAARQDRQATANARAEVFADLYAVHFLPVHAAAWQLALGALVRYGRPLRFATERDQRPLRYPLSTGYVMTETPTLHGTDAMVPAVQVSLPDHYYGKVSLPLGDIRRAQTARRESGREAATARALAALQCLPVVEVELLLATSHPGRVSSMWESGWEREVTYPRTWRQKGHNFHDEASQRRVAKELRTNPDVACWAAPTPVFNGYSRRTLKPPTIPTPEVAPYLAAEDHRKALERDLAAAERALQPIAMIGDMLSNLGDPLRDHPAFRRDLAVAAEERAAGLLPG